jgi:hypothetical protein
LTEIEAKLTSGEPWVMVLPAAYIATITQSFCIAWSKINNHLDIIMDDGIYRKLLSSNLTSCIQLTGANLHQFEPVTRMRAVVAKQDGLQDEVKSGLSVASMAAWPALQMTRLSHRTSTAGFLLGCQSTRIIPATTSEGPSKSTPPLMCPTSTILWF